MSGRGVLERFDLSGRVIVITGGSGLLGVEHAEAVAEAGGTPVLADVRYEAAQALAAEVSRAHGVAASAVELDVTSPESCRVALGRVLERHGRLGLGRPNTIGST